MRNKLAGLLVALAASVGCNTGTPGGSTTGDDKNKPVFGEREGTFRVTVPTLATKLKHGEAKVVALGIKRGKNFGEDVALKFENVPKGVTFEPADPQIKGSEEETKVTVKASEDASLGDFTVKVIGHPTSGADATNDLKLTIEKK